MSPWQNGRRELSLLPRINGQIASIRHLSKPFTKFILYPATTARNLPCIRSSQTLFRQTASSRIRIRLGNARLNENTNGLIRQYLPKGASFDTLDTQDVKAIMEKLNNRPRKSLGFKTPKELFSGDYLTVALGT